MAPARAPHYALDGYYPDGGPATSDASWPQPASTMGTVAGTGIRITINALTAMGFPRAHQMNGRADPFGTGRN